MSHARRRVAQIRWGRRGHVARALVEEHDEADIIIDRAAVDS